MKTYYQITCELYTEHVVPVINAKQYDSGRGVDITLTDCGAVVVPAVSDVCNLYCKKSDGTVSYISGAVNGSAVRVDFTNTLLAEAGVVECELEVTSGTDTVSTPVFRMVVLPSNYDQSAIESQNEFTALETALQTVSGLDGRVTALESTAATLGDAATYDVANNLTTATAGSAVLDAYQGKALNDAVNAKIQYFYTKYFTTGSNNTKLSIHNSEDQQRYFLFGSGSAGTTLCAIIYIRTTGTAYCQTMGTKSVSIEKSGENGVLTVGQWGAGTLICDSPFTFTYE